MNNLGITYKGKICQFPNTGNLIVFSDLHGNLRDFLKLEEIFRLTPNAYLLGLGDLIHGPNHRPDNWPDFMGSFYRDESGELVRRFFDLQKEFDGRVTSLLGNHEHSHIGGPLLSKYQWTDSVDEADHFEKSVGREKAREYNKRFNQFPLVATTESGVVFTHGAPYLGKDVTLEDLANLEYQGFADSSIHDIFDVDPLGRLLWARGCPQDISLRFLRNISRGRKPFFVDVYGHDPVESGYDKREAPCLCLSTSFRMKDQNKFYMKLDLSKTYHSVDEIRDGEELRKLYN